MSKATPFPPSSYEGRLAAPVFRRLTVVWALLGAILLGTGVLVAGALVPQTPRNDTPIVLDGEVWDVAQVGNAVVVAGNFTRVQTVRDGEIIDQAALFAFDIDSGALLTDFLPILTARTDVEVRDLVPAADGRSVYIGGKFTAIDDKTDGKVRLRNRIAKIDVTNGRLDRNFARGGVNAKVLSMDLHDGNLYVAGNFTTVYDTDIGRPPIDRAVNGLARFDATSGGFDTTFGFETRTAAGSIPWWEPGAGRTGGVAQIDVTPNGQYLAVAHRGMEIFDRNRNQVHRRPGLALIDLNANTVTGFQALYPDPADPVQDFYWAGQCRNGGIQIRDMEISPDGSYLVTVHQGTDAGYQCDTAVRWPITTNPTRPDWVSRLFDSAFSVEVDHDAIYVGGHMRHMVSPNAPSSYPGQTRPNGCCTGLPQMYDATFVLDAVHPNQRAFHSELKNPGLVYEIGQLGAINPATGKGIPSWNPGSDAWKGVLALELVDRGLLIGQDGPFGQESARINDINTGRAAFLDFDPDAGNPRCTAIVGDNGHVTINWTDIGNVAQWNIARNGQFASDTTNTTWTDTTPPTGEDLTYELRYRRNGADQTNTCGTVRVAPPAPDPLPDATCTTTVNGNDVTLTFNGDDYGRVTIQRDGQWQATIRDQNTYTQTLPTGTYTYTINGITSAQRSEAPCGTAAVAPGPVTCAAAVEDDIVTLSFNGDDYDRVTVRRDGQWQATLRDGETLWSDQPGPGAHSYSVQGIVDGFRSEAECGAITVAAAAAVCSTAVEGDVVTVSFNGADFNRVSIERDGTWLTTLDAGETSFVETVPTGIYEYTVRGIAGGVESAGSCGTAEVTPPALVCTVTVDGADVLLSWNDVGAASYQVRTNDAWTATLDAGTTEWAAADAADLGDAYAVRYRLGVVLSTIDCA